MTFNLMDEHWNVTIQLLILLVLTWQDMFQADDRIGFAFGQPQKHEDDEL